MKYLLIIISLLSFNAFGEFDSTQKKLCLANIKFLNQDFSTGLLFNEESSGKDKPVVKSYLYSTKHFPKTAPSTNNSVSATSFTIISDKMVYVCNVATQNKDMAIYRLKLDGTTIEIGAQRDERGNLLIVSAADIDNEVAEPLRKKKLNLNCRNNLDAKEADVMLKNIMTEKFNSLTSLKTPYVEQVTKFIDEENIVAKWKLDYPNATEWSIKDALSENRRYAVKTVSTLIVDNCLQFMDEQTISKLPPELQLAGGMKRLIEKSANTPKYSKPASKDSEPPAYEEIEIIETKYNKGKTTATSATN